MTRNQILFLLPVWLLLASGVNPVSLICAATPGWQEDQSGSSSEPPRSTESLEKEPNIQSLSIMDFDGPDPVKKRQAKETTVKDGVRTTKVVEARRELTIREAPTGGITVEIVRRYGPEDLERLKQNLPELADYIDMFPTKIGEPRDPNGEHQIELNLSVRSVYQARTAEELKARFPNAWNIYRNQKRSNR